MAREAILFDIQRFCVKDGPGIRTVLFFKGCGLACAWCHNPEGIRPAPELQFRGERCDGCEACVRRCRAGALSLGSDARVSIDWSRCTQCLDCASACEPRALSVTGRSWTAIALAAEVLRDRAYFVASGGGVTLSGGEPVLHSEFLLELLPLLRVERVPVLLETAGHYDSARLEPLFPWIDEIYFDLKLATDREHLRWTGSGRERVLHSLSLVARSGVPFRVRTPVVPGINADSIEAIDRELAALGIRATERLEYHGFGTAKLARIAPAFRVPRYSA